MTRSRAFLSSSSIAVSKTDPNTIYATAGGNIFVTNNDGSTWKQINIPGVTDHFKGDDLKKVDRENALRLLPRLKSA